jgi:sulfur carrier protein ThiS
MGIGFTAFNDKEHDFLQVSVNEKPIRLFNSKQLTVSDALILVGFNARKLLAERGESFQITFNGERRTILGDYGEPARIFVNGGPASLDTKLRNKDAIHIQPAVPGKKREMQLEELVDLHGKIKVNGHDIAMVRGVQVNGELKNDKYVLSANDTIDVMDIKNISDLAMHLDLSLEQIGFEVNGKAVEDTYILKRDDSVNWIRRQKESAEIITVEEVVEEIDLTRDEAIAEEVVAREEAIEKDADQVAHENVQKYYYFVVNGKQIEVESHKQTMVFVDIFEHIDFDISTPKGILDLKLNGGRARYTDILKTGDVIEIGWR